MSSAHQFLDPASQNIGWNNVYFNTVSCNNLNVAGQTGATGTTDATFSSIRLTDTTNQIFFGPSGSSNTVFDVITPASSQFLTIPDSGTGASNFILSNGSTQSINSPLTLNNTVTIPTGANSNYFLLSDVSGNATWNSVITSGSFSLALTGIWASDQNVTVKWTKIGFGANSLVTLVFPGLVVNATTSGLISNSSSPWLPSSNLYPITSYGPCVSINIADNNTQKVGLCTASSSSTFAIQSSTTGTWGNFSGSAGTGPSGFFPFSISYLSAS